MSGLKCTPLLLIVSMLMLSPGPLATGAEEAGGNHIIRETATLQPGDSTILRSDVACPEAVLMVVHEGSRVLKGDLLVELDDLSFRQEDPVLALRDLESMAQFEAAKAAVAARERESAMAVDIAKQALKLAHDARKRYLEVEFPDLQRRAEAERVRAQTRLVMVQSRQADASGPEAKAALQEAKMAVDEAESRLGFLTDYVRPQRQAELELTIARRTLDLERAKSQREEMIQRTKAELEIAETRLRQVSDRASFVRKQMAACKIHAPHDGIVRYEWTGPRRGSFRDHLQVGTVIASRQAIVRVETMEHPELLLWTTPAVANQVKSGQQATIRFHAMTQQTFRGHVTEVRVQPSGPGRAPQGLIRVQVDNPNEALRPGMSAVVEIEP